MIYLRIRSTLRVCDVPGCPRLVKTSRPIVVVPPVDPGCEATLGHPSKRSRGGTGGVALVLIPQEVSSWHCFTQGGAGC